LRYSDPSGRRECEDSLNCSLGNSTSTGIPGGNHHADSAGGSSHNASAVTCLEGNYSPRCPGWHFYTTTNLVCPAEDLCSVDEMKDWFLRFVYPGQDTSEPVMDEQSYSVSFCINNRCFPMGKYGAIVVDISDDGFTTTNTTKPTHILYNGKVVRHLYQGEGGAWYVSSYGYGNNTVVDALPPDAASGPDSTVPVSMAPANQLLGPFIFNNGDYQMFQTIILNH
jgi:hypothetical protein